MMRGIEELTLDRSVGSEALGQTATTRRVSKIHWVIFSLHLRKKKRISSKAPATSTPSTHTLPT